MKGFLIIILVLFLAFQLIQIDRTNKPIDPKLALNAPKEIEKILQKSCYDCHSNKTNYPWYSYIAPISWSIGYHIKEGRKALNFSTWNLLDKEKKIKKLKRCIQTVKFNMMPLPSYVWIHKDAILNKEQKKLLISYFDELLKKYDSDKN